MAQIDYKKIAAELRKLRCPQHHRPAGVEVNGTDLKIEACCDKFADGVNKKALQLMKSHADKIVQDIFKR